MDRLDALLAEISDEALRQKIESEVDYLRGRKETGLVFKRHIPEHIDAPNFPIVEGEHVALRGKSYAEPWEVRDTSNKEALCHDNQWRPLDDLVVVRPQHSPLFPFLEHGGSIGGGSGGRAPHALIKGENLQVLRLLARTMPESVDVIYIDPPYNTGARDWRYNNDYVDKADPFQHSKWLAMMWRRLLLAKRLLKPNGVIFVAINEVEQASLTLLMEEEVFPNHLVKNIAVECISGALSGARLAGLVTSHESLVVAFPEDAKDILSVPNKEVGETTDYPLYAHGAGSGRRERPSAFYPIWLNPETLEVVEVGEVLPVGESPCFDPRPDGAVPIWPVVPATKRRGAEERGWRMVRGVVKEHIESGKVWFKRDPRALNGIMGKVSYLGKERTVLKSLWKNSLYNNGRHGTGTLNDLFGETEVFPFPKSPYSVRKAIESVCHDRPDAVILDFFAGSGSTMDAVCLLNAEDDGRRRCILVSNNEIGSKNKGGIFDEVLEPRVHASLTGKRKKDGSDAAGEWILHSDNEEEDWKRRPRSLGFPGEKAEVFRLLLAREEDIRRGQSRESLIPTLWLASGAASEVPDIAVAREKGFVAQDDFVVLLEASKMTDMLAQKSEGETLHLLLEDDHGSVKGAAAERSSFRKIRSSYDGWRDHFSSPEEEAEG